MVVPADTRTQRRRGAAQAELLVGAVAALVLLGAAETARGDGPMAQHAEPPSADVPAPASATPATAPRGNASADPSSRAAPVIALPPLDIPYIQYGVAFTAEFVAAAGPICATSPCILGSGGGVVARVGRRAAGPWYFGAAYELSKQDPSSLYRFATLQQARAEARWYLNTGLQTSPYATFGAGVAAYGNEWGIDTYGPAGFAGIGVETQISRRTVVGLSIAYRIIGLRSFVDSSDNARPGGVAQLVGIDLSLEERSPIARVRSPY